VLLTLLNNTLHSLRHIVHFWCSVRRTNERFYNTRQYSGRWEVVKGEMWKERLTFATQILTNGSALHDCSLLHAFVLLNDVSPARAITLSHFTQND
jgi:hypothetical protein